MKDLIGTQIDTTELQKELETAHKALRRTLGVQRKLESQLDNMDIDDPHYERKYESLNRRLNQTFEAIDDLEQRIKSLELRMDNAKKEQLSRDSVYEYLLLFDQIYDRMTDREKKTFMKSFIDHIEIYPEKQKNGQQLKTIYFKFPVSYNGGVSDVISLPNETMDETVCLLSKLNADKHIDVELDMDELDLTAAESKATYQEIKKYILVNYGVKVSSLYIAQI